MQKLTDAHGVPVTLRGLRFTINRLKSRADTSALAIPLEQARRDLAAAQDGLEQAQDDRIAANAQLQYADGRVDQQVISIGMQGRALVNNNREDERYVVLLPTQPSKATQGIADDVQNRYVAHLLNTLENDARLAALKPLAAPLRAAQDAVTEALRAREASFGPETRAMVERRTVLDRAQRAYNATFPQLQVVLGDDALAETFFRSFRKDAGGGAADTPEDPDVG